MKPRPTPQIDPKGKKKGKQAPAGASVRAADASPEGRCWNQCRDRRRRGSRPGGDGAATGSGTGIRVGSRWPTHSVAGGARRHDNVAGGSGSDSGRQPGGAVSVLRTKRTQLVRWATAARPASHARRWRARTRQQAQAQAQTSRRQPTTVDPKDVRAVCKGHGDAKKAVAASGRGAPPGCAALRRCSPPASVNRSRPAQPSQHALWLSPPPHPQTRGPAGPYAFLSAGAPCPNLQGGPHHPLLGKGGRRRGKHSGTADAACTGQGRSGPPTRPANQPASDTGPPPLPWVSIGRSGWLSAPVVRGGTSHSVPSPAPHPKSWGCRPAPPWREQRASEAVRPKGGRMGPHAQRRHAGQLV